MKIKKLAAAVLLFSIGTALADTYSWGNVFMGGGGMVTGLIPTSEQGVMYARTDVGGAYRWNASSAKWTPLLDWVSEDDKGLYGVESMAADPQNAANVYILAGTSYFSSGKTVVMRSSNYGASFDTTVVTSMWTAHGNGDGRQAGEKLAVDPNNSSILFCGTRSNTLYKSSDKGASWSLASSSFGSANAAGVNFVVFDSSSASGGTTQRIFVGVGASGGLYMSTNGGSSFTKLSNVPSYIPHRAAVVGGNLYVTFTDVVGPWSVGGGAFYKYNISGSSWTNLTPSGYTSGYGFGNVSVDRSNTSRILLSTCGMWSDQQTYSATGSTGWGDFIFLSTDGGSSWTLIDKYISNNGFKWLDGNAIHIAGSAVFDPFDTDKAWVNSGNGVFEATDINGSSTVWYFQAKGIEETVPLDILSIPDGPLAVAIGDYDGGVYSDITQSVALPSPALGTTSGLAYAYTAGVLVRVGASAIYYSSNNGSSWTKFSSMNGTKGKLAITADGGTVIHAPWNSTSDSYTGSIYYTTDHGSSWTAISGVSLGTNSNFVCDPVNASYCYVLNSSGTLFASSDGGKTFSSSGSTGSSSFGLLRVVPGHEGHLWAPLEGNGLAYSTDKGASWTKLSGVYAYAVGIGKAATGASYETLYIWGYTSSSSTKGFYRSTDMGASWVRINDDAHQFGGPGNGNFVIGDMNTYGRVYMGTVGRGVIYGDVASTTTSSSSVASSSSSETQSSSSAETGVTLNKHGSASSTQTVETGSAIDEFSYAWGGTATGVNVTGLPDGVTAVVNSDSSVLISGTVTADAGTYAFTVTTVGGDSTAVKTGTITVTEELTEVLRVHASGMTRFRVQGTCLRISVAGAQEMVLRFYGLDGTLLGTQMLHTQESTVSLAPYAGKGVVLCRLVSAQGRLIAQKNVVLP